MSLLLRKALSRNYFSLIRNITINSRNHSVIHLGKFSAPCIKQCNHFISRLERLKSTNKQLDDDDEDFNADSTLSKDSKVVIFSATSLRTDGVLKSALNMSRNKIELLFYESRVRVNGKKLLKKSASVKEGDEIDIIKQISPRNPDHLYVSRIEVLKLAAKEESISITVRRFKTLLIENYENDPYKGSSESNN